MRELGRTAVLNLVGAVAAIGGVVLVEQLRDPTSSLRLHLAELADHLPRRGP